MLQTKTRIQVQNKDHLKQIHYMGLTEEQLLILARHQSTIMPYIEEIVDKLYDEIYQEPSFRTIIDQHSTLSRLKSAQKKYLMDSMAGYIDDKYIEDRYRVGQVHARIGLGLTWYVATYNRYMEILISIIHREIPEEEASLIQAIHSIFNFDIQIILGSYNQQEVDRAANPLHYEMERIRYLVGFTNEDIEVLNEYGGMVTFQSSSISKKFRQLYQQRLHQHPSLLEVPTEEEETTLTMEKMLIQFFQDRIYVASDEFYRTLRDWSSLVIEGRVDQYFYSVVGDCLVQAVSDVLVRDRMPEPKLIRFFTALNHLVNYTLAVLQEVYTPYLFFRDLNVLGIYAYEIDMSDFGKITWLDERIKQMIAKRDGTTNVDYRGKRCYELLRGRHFRCPDCPIVSGDRDGTLFVWDKNGVDQFYKIRHIPQTKIFGLSRALLTMQDSTQEGKVIFETIEQLLHLAEYKDADTGEHVFRIGRLSAELARLVGCDETFISHIRTAAPFHDIGKIGIPDSILSKPGSLTSEERESMKTHAEIGHQILSNLELPVLQMAARIAETHHEWWNGKGYPKSLAGEAIPLEGRIVAIVDVFDALLSKRAYKPAFPVEKVRDILWEGRGVQFDPHLIDLFMNMWEEFVSIQKSEYEVGQTLR
ncbi:protoglobin domain-containing protein [Ammoniphilus sp. CFH 90114]|uniref:protoglobin domain-containing protein n=1 Tax=Ammoniphilus sp. CFH 90114 TaxID=2493665 RepID=UPI0013E99D76|nr:protoglobin domain-containing protein [Ammoniphilus sp. CFH 90114]